TPAAAAGPAAPPSNFLPRVPSIAGSADGSGQPLLRGIYAYGPLVSTDPSLKTERSSVRVTYQDLAQCEHSLSNLGVSKKNVDHGAAGAEIISQQNLKDAGVIGSARSAELYGLNILECNFQDASPNVTRYLVLARTANIPKEYEQYKTSIVFGLEEGPGTLHKALVAFWKRDLNLTKIESRPNRGKPMRTLGTEKQFNYIFYVDFEASVAEIPAQNALKELEEIASFLRVLGCYPSTSI
ncbi:arogenate dehydratase/prephenate dehydratase 2, chloroplastic-like, partial [Panicum virgatum]|uniref:arogenate dehydratase/prephenate dehydratase 2, chloroplastic-like n=1 Tax=Panicum virgatum TaxID=38727 RepID=UPI0019D625F7